MTTGKKLLCAGVSIWVLLLISPAQASDIEKAKNQIREMAIEGVSVSNMDIPEFTDEQKQRIKEMREQLAALHISEQ